MQVARVKRAKRTMTGQYKIARFLSPISRPSN